MKKIYAKPLVFIDNFSICTNIAAGCEATTNLQYEGKCGYPMVGGRVEDAIVFTGAETGCTTTEVLDEEDAYNGICYHIPYGENLFNS